MTFVSSVMNCTEIMCQITLNCLRWS